MSCYPKSNPAWGWHAPSDDCSCGSLPDWKFEDCDLQAGDELNDAVITSLYMQAPDEDRFPKGGWWGSEFIDQGVGSRLWTLQNETVNGDFILKAERYSREALSWLLDIGAIGGLRVFGEIVSGQPVVSVELCSRSGDVIFSKEFERLWVG